MSWYQVLEPHVTTHHSNIGAHLKGQFKLDPLTSLHNVSLPYSITYLNRTTINFDWCVIMCGAKVKHQNDMCLMEIGLCAQKL